MMLPHLFERAPILQKLVMSLIEYVLNVDLRDADLIGLVPSLIHLLSDWIRGLKIHHICISPI